MALQIPGKGKTVNFGPGAAQPKQPSGGTAYNPTAGHPFSAWSAMPANAPDTWRPNGMRDNMARPPQQSAGMPQNTGGTWASGPVPGTTMYRPPVNDSPYGRPMGDALPPPPGAFGGQPQAGRPPAQPGQRTPITRPTPGRAPGEVSAHPAGLSPSTQPYYDEVMRQLPGIDRFKAAEMANQFRAQQERERREITNPVKPMPAERSPQQIAAGRQQQRQREQAQERQRQKARKTQARNDRMR